MTCLCKFNQNRFYPSPSSLWTGRGFCILDGGCAGGVLRVQPQEHNIQEKRGGKIIFLALQV